MLLQEPYDSSLIQIHEVVTKLNGVAIRVCFQVVHLRDAHLDFIQCFTKTALPVAFLLLLIDELSHFCLQLARLFDELSQELVPLFLLFVLLKFGLFKLVLCLKITRITGLHVLIHSSQTLFVLIHAQRETVLQLLLFYEYNIVVDLLTSFPLPAELLLNVDDHVVPIPLATMLNVLYERVSNFAHFDSRQYL